MSSRHLLLVASLLAAPSLAAAAPDDASSFRRTHVCGTRQVPGPGTLSSQVARAGDAPRTIFLNRNGGTYHVINAATNAATQTANARVVSGDGRNHEAVIAPLAPDFDWAAISACVRKHYEPYDVRIVEERPAAGPYIEAVVGGRGTEIGWGADSLFGIASADNFCGVTEAGIAFSFSETHRGVPRRDEELCATIAHEVGHLLALEHETLATDLMSYVFVADTSSKSFVNANSPCGVEPGQNQPCSCTNGSTNSAARLLDFVGPFTPRSGQGEACVSGGDCEGGQCVTQSGDQYCTTTCDLANDACPSGYVCTQAGGIAVCAFEDGGGCCSTGQRPGAGTGLLALGVGLLIVRRRRRR